MPQGLIRLHVSAGDFPARATKEVTFMIVDQSLSSYNAIFGQPALSQFRAALSTYRQLMKFPTNMGVGLVRSDQGDSRSYYNNGAERE